MSRRSYRSILLALLWAVAAAAQEPTLTKYSEAGFRRFMKMAEAGQLGNEVSAANVSVSGNRVRVELVGSGTTKVVVLKFRASTQTLSRYFDLEDPGGATPGDLALIGKALDTAFGNDDPFEAATDFFGASPAESIPSLVAAWEDDGWRGVLLGVERRMTVLASRSYAVTVIVGLTVALWAGLLLLWGSSADGARPRR